MGHGPISNEVLLARIESSYGVDPVPVAATHAILFSGLELVPFDQLRMVDREAVRASLGTLPHGYAGSLGGIRFRAELKGSGAAGTAPEIGPLLRACGLGETIVASTSVTYAPVSTAIESVTIYAFEFGRVRHIYLGCRGNATLRFAAGELGSVQFEFMGRRGTVTDQTQPVPTINTTVPRGVRGLNAQVGGVSGLVIQEFELALNNRIVAPPNVNDSEGYGNITALKRDPVIQLTKHAELIATLNPYADLTDGTNRAFVSGNYGSVAGNIINLNCPQTRYRSVEPGEGDGFRNRRIMLGCHEAAADSDFSLAFT